MVHDTGKPVDINRLITRMQADLVELTAAGDARRYFHATYLRTTEAVAAEITRGGFSDGRWVAHWDVVFSRLARRGFGVLLTGA